MEPEKSSEMKWFDLDGLPEDMVECRRMVVGEYEKENCYSEFFENA